MGLLSIDGSNWIVYYFYGCVKLVTAYTHIIAYLVLPVVYGLSSQLNSIQPYA